jgi:hypothetical protein
LKLSFKTDYERRPREPKGEFVSYPACPPDDMSEAAERRAEQPADADLEVRDRFNRVCGWRRRCSLRRQIPRRCEHQQQYV